MSATTWHACCFPDTRRAGLHKQRVSIFSIWVGTRFAGKHPSGYGSRPYPRGKLWTLKPETKSFGFRGNAIRGTGPKQRDFEFGITLASQPRPLVLAPGSNPGYRVHKALVRGNAGPNTATNRAVGMPTGSKK